MEPHRDAILLIALSFVLSPLAYADESPTVPGRDDVEQERKPRLVAIRRAWDTAPHNGCADLTHFGGEIVAAVREGQSDVLGGAIRIIASPDGKTWESRALLTASDVDLRAPHLSVAPTGQLQLVAGAALPADAPARHQTLLWRSADSRNWSASTPVGEPNFWIWDLDWRDETAYGIGYPTGGQDFARLYQSADGRRFRPVVDQLLRGHHPGESALLFLADSAAICLARRGGQEGTTLAGRASAPFTEWTWSDTGRRVAGADMVQLADGRVVVGTHLFSQGVATALCWLDPEDGSLDEFLRLPFAGQPGSLGLLALEDRLWVGYPSAHEGKVAVYVAEIQL